MKLQTNISLEKQSNNQIDYNSKILLLGSCFAENIGKKLDYFKFQNTINPFGILFHPKAIEAFITNVINQKEFTTNDIFFHNECWHSFDAHSKLSNSSKDSLLEELNNQTSLTANQLNDFTHIIITLGTAWVYKHIESDKIVANCHTIPQKQFKKEILSVREIVKSLVQIEHLVRIANKNIQIIYTVSPVRHIKDGFVQNQLSKSHLITAIHQHISHNSVYFPSYEIMMDELRDYRFYDQDMLHPNQTAINYIWEKFIMVWISTEALTTMGDVENIQKGLRHKPFNPSSNSHKQFLQKIEDLKAKLQSKFSHIVF